MSPVSRMRAMERLAHAVKQLALYRHMNMFVTETLELATTQAQQADLRRRRHVNTGDTESSLGALDGLIFALKDNFCTRAVRTTCGSRMLEHFTPAYSATVYDRLLAAGSIMLGKTNMDEFGMGSISSSYFATVHNPAAGLTPLADGDFYVSGGSSGGSAAAVSAQLVDFAIGSDTGGSVRNPAAMCGCIGYKPTYGLISRYGLVPLNNYLDTVGIMAGAVPQLVDVLNAIAGPDIKDATCMKSPFEKIQLEANFTPRKFTIGVPQEFFPAGLSTSNYQAWQQAARLFETHGGATLVSVSLPSVIYSMSCYSVLTSCEVASNFARYDGIKYGYHAADESTVGDRYHFKNVLMRNRDAALGDTVKSRIVSGNYFQLKENFDKYFVRSHRMRSRIADEFATTFANGVDALITPTCFHDTPKYQAFVSQRRAFDETDFFTACANIAGVPAITLPVGSRKPAASTSERAMPIGVQIMAPVGNDRNLLNLANWFVNTSKEHGVFD